jgi:hypothetical protein
VRVGLGGRAVWRWELGLCEENGKGKTSVGFKI